MHTESFSSIICNPFHKCRNNILHLFVFGKLSTYRECVCACHAAVLCRDTWVSPLLKSSATGNSLVTLWVMLWGGEDTLLHVSAPVHWSLLCEHILRGQQPGIVERLSIPRSLWKQPLRLQFSPSLTSPSSPAFRIICTFSFGWLSCWVMRYTSRKLKQAWSGLAT